MRILVTGGAGYIGSHTAKRLAAAGHEPVVLDNLSTGHRWTVQWGPFIRGDVGDRALVGRLLREHEIGGVIHFAASSYVGESVIEPRRYFRNNVVNTLALLDGMTDAGVDRVVFSSTCATYGVPDVIPIAEQQPQRPVNPYGDSKLFVERVLHAYGQAYGLRSVALRYFNASGADPEGDLGEDHDPEPHLLPLVIEAAIGRRDAIEIFGSDYPTPDGTAIRGYIHVVDLADAHVRALDYLLAGGESTALNLGTGVGHSVAEIVDAVERIGGRPVPVRPAPRRTGDPPALVANPGKAATVLGWTPRHSDIETIVRTAWRWHVAGLPAVRSARGAREAVAAGD